MNAKDRTNADHNLGKAYPEAKSDIHARFARALESLSIICDELEDVADKLPDSVDTQSCLRTAQRLLAIVTNSHRLEEDLVFPLLMTQTSKINHLTSTLERLRYEHWGDEEFAIDIHHALREFVRLRDKAKVDSLAWMLRGFFDGMRRHIAFDREYLLPIVSAIVSSQSENGGQSAAVHFS